MVGSVIARGRSRGRGQKMNRGIGKKMLEETIEAIRNILRSEGITNEESIDYSVAFLVVRYLDEDLCRRLRIPPRFAYGNLFVEKGKELSKQELYDKVHCPGSKSCLFYYLTTVLGMKSLKDFKLKGIDNFHEILSLLKPLEMGALDSRFDIIGTVYEYHLKKGVSNPRDLGQYFTPRKVVEFMVALCSPRPGELVVDPTMGTGGFLTMVAKHLQKHHGPIAWGEEKHNVVGFDISERVSNLGFLNLLLETGESFSVSRRDVLREDIVREGVRLRPDVILSNVPMGLKGTNYRACCDRIKEVGIEAKAGEPLFLQLFANALLEGGRAAVIVSWGFLFHSNKRFVQTREYLVKNFDVKKVVALRGDDFFINTGAQTYIVYFEKTGATRETEFSVIEAAHDGIRETTLIKVNSGEIAMNDYSLDSQRYFSQEKIEGIPYARIKDICRFLPKSRRPASFGKDEGRYPFFTSSSKVKRCDEADYQEECVIVGNGGVANVKISSCFSCSDHNFVIQSKDPRVSNKYIYFYFANHLHVLQSGFHGTGLENLSMSYLKDIEIPLLSLEVQNKLDDVHRNIREAEEELERQKKAFQEIFARELGTSPGTPDNTQDGSPSPRVVVSLSKKIAELPPGKVLDVSRIDRNGKGSRTRDPPGGNSGSRGVPGLSLVSSERETLSWALEILGEEYGRDLSSCLEAWDQGSGTPGSSRGKGPGLRERMEGLGEDKVLDVSRMDGKGKGARVINRPRGKGKKREVPGLPMVSDQRDSYARALEILGEETGEDFSRFLGEWDSRGW